MLTLSVFISDCGHAVYPSARAQPVPDVSALKVGDIVLCKVAGNEYLHLVKAIQGQRFQIGNNRGFINGWIGPNGIYGRCIKVEA
jgi:hypothetical protein